MNDARPTTLETFQYHPRFIPPHDTAALSRLRAGGGVWRERDLVLLQLQELLTHRCQTTEGLLLADLLEGTPLNAFGMWVHLPWSGQLVRVLPAPLFRELRLNRIGGKITDVEHAMLQVSSVGICGLSQGNPVALALVQEGSAGRLVLADPGVLATGHLNRVAAPIHAVGLPKTVVTARQIAEVDPFVEVVCLHRGLELDDLDAFVADVDVVVDATDSPSLQTALRLGARRACVPVVMATHDRGRIDVERFDLDPARPLWTNGANAQDTPCSAWSTRTAADMVNRGSTTHPVPRLTTDVLIGTASVCSAIRRIVLGQECGSGQRFVDVVGRPAESSASAELPLPPVVPATSRRSIHRALVEGAVTSPSLRNRQPWRFVSDGDLVQADLRPGLTCRLVDPDGDRDLLALGGAIEGFSLRASQLGLVAVVTYGEATGEPLATLRLEEGAGVDPLAEWLGRRQSDRRSPPPEPLRPVARAHLLDAFGGDAEIELIEAPSALANLSTVVGDLTRVHQLTPGLHTEFWEAVRWTPEEASAHPTGLPVEQLAVGSETHALLRMLARPDVAAFLRSTGGGQRLRHNAAHGVRTASCLGAVSCKRDSASLLRAGRSFHRLWLAATAEGYALQPLDVLPGMVRHLNGPLESMYLPADAAVVRRAREMLARHLADPENVVVAFRVFPGGPSYATVPRLPLEAVFEQH